MFGTYLKIVFRNLRKKRADSFFSLFGLSIGLTAGILIFQYIAYEKEIVQNEKEKSSGYITAHGTIIRLIRKQFIEFYRKRADEYYKSEKVCICTVAIKMANSYRPAINNNFSKCLFLGRIFMCWR